MAVLITWLPRLAMLFLGKIEIMLKSMCNVLQMAAGQIRNVKQVISKARVCQAEAGLSFNTQANLNMYVSPDMDNHLTMLVIG